jgi:chromosome segregation ATPase
MDEVLNGDNEPATKGELKSEMNALRVDFSSFRSEFRGEFSQFRQELREEIRELFRPITITLANHTAELADIRGHIKNNMVTRDEFHSRMDGFTRRVDDFDYSAAKNRDRLDDHAKRISALEEKRS